MPLHSIDDVLEELDTLLSQIILLQRNPVSKVCRRCENVCCTHVQFLFDEKDLIYQKLSKGGGIQRLGGRNKKGCSYLTDAGCSLGPAWRPFTCHRYICPDLEDAMTAFDPQRLAQLNQNFAAVDELRSTLWRMFLER